MEEQGMQERRPDVFSTPVRAGKRTYFFDVKITRNGQNYLTITESKRRFLNDEGKFIYEKHKIFLYREDFEKFIKGLDGAIRFIENGEYPEAPADTDEDAVHMDVNFDFEDLDRTDSEKDSE